METNMTSSNIIVRADHFAQEYPISVASGSARNFRGVIEPAHYINRPLMINTWTQTTNNDFSVLNIVEVRDCQSQREKELEEKIRVLEENLKAHTELLSQIHATSARTSALLGQSQSQNQHDINNTGFNNSSCNNSATTRTATVSPKIVNAINCSQQVSYSPTDSVKYRIIADGTGNHTDEPIEIQLAEDDGALNLNSSADSGRLEICLAPEENIEIKSEYNTNNNAMTTQDQGPTTSTYATLSEHHFIKKRKLAADQQVSPTTNPKCDNIQQKTPNQKPRCSRNSLLNTPNTENENNNSCQDIQTTPVQNILPPPKSNNNSAHYSGNSIGHHVTIDMEHVMVSIGPNNTRVPAKLYDSVNWTSASIATRKLLMATFDRKVLATHSMTGKPSPAFKDHGKPIKQMLDPLVIADIIFAVTRKCNVSDKEVRNAITTKCADENKMMKLQMNKRTPMKEINKENLVG